MYSATDLGDTIVALSTPPGEGAIGVIRLSGNRAIELIGTVFRGRDLSDAPSHTLHFGNIEGPDGKVLDEVVVGLFRAPTSYTREDVVEISCHGSPYILNQLLQLLMQRGARLAQPGEFTMRAFLNGRMDLSQAEAVADLIASESEVAHQVALHQMRGGVSKDINALREELINFASLIELELDFSEEDVEFADRQDLKALVHRIRTIIGDLMDSFRLGNAIKQGVSTVLAGRPNAGKSTLLNALLNEERAIVSEIAGTTRDTIEETITIEGIPFRLIDTAGIREASDQIEAIGVARTLEKIRQSSVLLYIFDIIDTPPEAVASDLAKLSRDGLHIMLIANKMDLNPYAEEAHYADALNQGVGKIAFVPVSAQNRQNIPWLRRKLAQLVLGGSVAAGSTILTNARHFEALSKADACLGTVLEGLESGISGDFLAMDIRQALYHLGEITGQVTTDDLLGNIFSRFCIGK